MGTIKALSNRIINSQLARNAFWMFLGQGLRIIIQAIYFVLIARSLGSKGYGAFIGVCALVAILSPFSGLGCGNLLIKNVARDAESFKRYWGNALLMILISGTVLMIIVLGVSQIVLPAAIPFSLVFTVAVSDLYFTRALDMSGQAFQAFQRLERTALIQVLPNLFRLLAVVVLSIYVQSPTPIQWGYLYLITIIISTLLAMLLVHRELGSPVFALADTKRVIREGFYFSIGESARSIYDDIDKTMLIRFATLEAVGIYGAAYKIIDVSLTPIRSLLYATYARFFQHGAMGIRGSISFAKSLFPVTGGFGIFVGVLLYLAAPLLPYILGTEFSGAADALRWLAPLPFLKAIHFFAADSLTGAGFQGLRSGIQVFVALFNVGINLWLIPAYSWRGAAWASIASDGLLAVFLCIILYYLSSRKNAVANILDKVAKHEY
jgi:O-antigen/teichoic acid export membrane protein